ncbi:MAG: radical SAM protein, partial [Firmicutes bacterium]|nr:radical SAM protein [Bacillota bacterium]
MKKHAIIPIFISHRGCPNDCVFCNQKKITSREGDVRPEDVRNTIEQWLTTLKDVETVEVSFYGGSFTGIPMEQQSAFLEIAKEYKDSGRIDAIHLSTRPDYIDVPILDNLKAYSVDVIELGVQSFSDRVLLLSGRGHDAACVYKACDLIKSYGFTLGIQLMIGLPGDSMDTCRYSALETVKIGPAIARLYPTVTILGTELYSMMERGEYSPLTLDEAVERTKVMYEILEEAGINIIRVGLKSSE